MNISTQTTLAANAPNSQPNLRFVLDTVRCVVAGTVWERVPDPDNEKTVTDQPAVSATVRLQDHAFQIKTDVRGRFRFPSLRPGLYILQVETQSGATQTREIQVPPSYDMVIDTVASTTKASNDEPAAPDRVDELAQTGKRQRKRQSNKSQ